MENLAVQEVARLETVERIESRFEQKHVKAFYSEQEFFLFPAIFDTEGEVSFDVSSAAWHHGIQTKVHLSGFLYCHWIRNRYANPIKNIATLCHAFLYHVDLDKENTVPLVFTVPGIGTDDYTVKAVMRGWREQFIFFDIA